MDFQHLTLFATAAFGIEGLVSAELKRLGFQDTKAELGGARFSGSILDGFFACLRLRMADRVQIILAERECLTFEDLFQLVSSIPWEQILTTDGQYNVSGKCARSQLMSISDCQSICKKAIIERMKKCSQSSYFPETGAAFPIHLSIHENRARVCLDLTGSALNRRGYRTWNGEAPLRETLAASLVELSPWFPGMPLHDPCCGTGTILIEAAFRQGHRAPGMLRSFACESFPFFPAAEAQKMRSSVVAEFEPERIAHISGSDIDPQAIELARRHVDQASLSGMIDLHVEPLETLQLDSPEGVFICNPPYGERLGDRKSCEKIYAHLHDLMARHPGWSLCAISSDPAFEKAFGVKPDK
ncbi:MAG: class I SAM-dependent RNA methyltransferase, partial [Clostridia bacterium]|nr:class I SAM-dependent RNA methyltransferase [Clostridia bacterium]